jgi:hypothetical protein
MEQDNARQVHEAVHSDRHMVEINAEKVVSLVGSYHIAITESMSPKCGVSSGCRQRRQPPDMEGS